MRYLQESEEEIMYQTDFESTYRYKTDEELKDLYFSKDSLTQPARAALNKELHSRSLTLGKQRTRQAKDHAPKSSTINIKDWFDWTALLRAIEIAFLAIVGMIVLAYFEKMDLVMTAFISVFAIVYAVRDNWSLRRHSWFWFILFVIASTHFAITVFTKAPSLINRLSKGGLEGLFVLDMVFIQGIMRLAAYISGIHYKTGMKRKET